MNVNEAKKYVKENYIFHPACEAFPIMSDGELQRLADDIKINYQRMAIVRIKGTGQIIDGRNRLIAAHLAGVEPRISEMGLKTNDQIIGMIISLNDVRRHSTASQRAIIAAKLEKLYSSNSGKSIHRAAEAVGVSDSYAERGKKLLKDDPEKANEVLDGKKSLQKAREETRKKNKKKARAGKKTQKHRYQTYQEYWNDVGHWAFKNITEALKALETPHWRAFPLGYQRQLRQLQEAVEICLSWEAGKLQEKCPECDDGKIKTSRGPVIDCKYCKGTGKVGRIFREVKFNEVNQ